ncbi:MAG: redox-sensing transcriptional repressor [Firmicutes bacterium]|nr:redox-sensing transcriptional repressor [Bacillota bacterium]
MKEKDQASISISTQALHRMPYYLQYLKKLHSEGVEIIAAPAIAESLDLNEVQVRKDFAAVSKTKGKPRSGFSVSELIENMEEFLGYRNIDDAVLIGAGSLGKALLSYKGFGNYGLNIVAAFDTDDSIVGSDICGKSVLPASKLCDICRRMNIHIAIIAVPADQAQAVCDQLVSCGILGIWNFAPVHLSTPENILVQNVNMAASLALLSKHLRDSFSKQRD